MECTQRSNRDCGFLRTYTIIQWIYKVGIGNISSFIYEFGMARLVYQDANRVCKIKIKMAFAICLSN